MDKGFKVKSGFEVLKGTSPGKTSLGFGYLLEKKTRPKDVPGWG